MSTRTGAVPAVLTAFALAASAPLGKKLATWSNRQVRAAESFAAGACLAFVIADLMIELTSKGAARAPAPTSALGPVDERFLFAVVLLGATGWFVLGALAAQKGGPETRYWAYLVPQAIYAVFVGEALALEAGDGAWALVLFALPILLHLTVIESHIHVEFPRQHLRLRRATLAIMPGLATLAWALVGFSHNLLVTALALVAGITVLQVMQTELPPVSLVRIWPFLGGVVIYSTMAAVRWARSIPIGSCSAP